LATWLVDYLSSYHLISEMMLMLNVIFRSN
jgi:hypothetical protein